MQTSRRTRRAAFLGLLALLALPLSARAQLPFVPFSARSVAMGGAALGLTDGSASVLDNPAAASERQLDAALSLGVAGVESGNVLKPLKVVSGNDVNVLASGANPGSAADVKAALKTLGDPGNALLGDGRTGLAVAYKGWTLTVSATAWAGAFARPDLVHVQAGNDPATSWKGNTSRVAFRALTLEDVGVSKAWHFLAGRVKVGGGAHVLRGVTSVKEESAFTTEVGDSLQLSRRGFSGTERTTTRVSLDAGFLVSIGVLKVGGVVKGINEPDFAFDESAPALDRGQTVRYGRQARVGASVHLPVTGLTLAADYDVSKNETLVPGTSSRKAGGGLEWVIGPLALRGGIQVNLESPDKTPLFSAGAGLGLPIIKLRVDAAAIYRPDKSALGAVLTLRAAL